MKTNTMELFMLGLISRARWLVVIIVAAIVGQVTAHAGDHRYMYLANQDNNTITYYNQSGTLIGVFADSGKGINSPIGLAFDCNGNLYVANYGTDTVRKISSTGEDLGDVITLSPGSSIRCVVVDVHNLVYVSCANSNTVNRYTAAGKFIDVFASTGLSAPIGMNFDPAGNLYVVNYSGTIRKIAPDGTDLGNFITGLTQPTDIVVDSCGYFYVASDYPSTVKKYTSAGTYDSDVITGGANGRLAGLGLDALGGLYVVGHDNNTVYKICTGSVSSFAASDGNNPNFITFGPAKLLNW